MIIVGLEWETGQSGANQTPAWPTNWAWRPECLGQCCVGRSPRAGGDSNMPWTTQAIPHVRPSSLSTPAATDWLTLDNQPTSLEFCSREFLLETLQVGIAAPSCLTSLVYSSASGLASFIPLNCTDRPSPSTWAHLHRTTPPCPNPPARLPIPTPPSSHTVLFKTCKYASY